MRGGFYLYRFTFSRFLEWWNTSPRLTGCDLPARCTVFFPRLVRLRPRFAEHSGATLFVVPKVPVVLPSCLVVLSPCPKDNTSPNTAGIPINIPIHTNSISNFLSRARAHTHKFTLEIHEFHVSPASRVGCCSATVRYLRNTARPGNVNSTP